MGLPLGLTLTDYRGSSFAPAKEVERSSAEEAGVVLPHADQVERSSAEEAGVGLPGNQQVEAADCRSYHSTKLKDGAGLCSTLDWQLPPPEAWPDRLSSVRSAIWRTLPPGAASRWGALPIDGPMFAGEEVAAMRAEVCSALGVDLDWAEKSFELTPYKFNLLEAMAARLGDMDVGLCAVLKEGAPTGVGAKIPASGIWPRLDTEDPVDGAMPDLVLCASNRTSACR